jgi:hypothetical protein
MTGPEQILPKGADALVVRPGDTLVLRFGSEVGREQFKAFWEQNEPDLRERLPDVKIICLGGGVEQMAVYRPDRNEGG